MNRYHYDRMLLHNDFRHQRSGFDKVIGALHTGAVALGSIAHAAGAVKRTVDIVTGKAPPMPYPSPRLSPYVVSPYAFGCWSHLPPVRVSALDSWRRASQAMFIDRMRYHRPPPSRTMAMYHNHRHHR